jgi:hypothetical protein
MNDSLCYVEERHGADRSGAGDRRGLEQIDGYRIEPRETVEVTHGRSNAWRS